jgi:hypothetical protein
LLWRPRASRRHPATARRRRSSAGRSRPVRRRERQPGVGVRVRRQRLRRPVRLRPAPRLVPGHRPAEAAGHRRADVTRGHRPGRVGRAEGARAVRQVEPAAHRVARLADHLPRRRGGSRGVTTAAAAGLLAGRLPAPLHPRGPADPERLPRPADGEAEEVPERPPAAARRPLDRAGAGAGADGVRWWPTR